MINIGDFVKITNTSMQGKVIDITENNKYIININDKNLITDESKLEKLMNRQDTFGNNVIINFNNDLKNNDFIPEIMIRHQTVEEALYNLDVFVSEAIYYNVATVRIIHGKHGGILRHAVHEYLKENKNIISFRLGNYFEGSYGVTIAKLK